MVYNRCTNHNTCLILEYGECEITAKGPPIQGLKVIFNSLHTLSFSRSGHFQLNTREYFVVETDSDNEGVR